MEPLVSVIIPVYNVRPYLREALDSVLQQTYSHLEILIIDDGSTDGSGSVCDEYRSDPRVRVIHQENRGLSGARNTGLNNMNGQVVSFLDPDDAFLPKTIETALEAMRRYGADMVILGYARYCTVGRLDEARIISSMGYEKEEALASRDAAQALIEGRINNSVCNKLYAREIWNTLRFPEGKVYEDICVSYQAIHNAKKILTVPGYWALYRQRKGSITQTKTSKNMRDMLDSYAQIEGFVQKNIPTDFCERQLTLLQERHLRGAIAQYSRPTKAERFNAGDLRQEILNKGKKIGITAMSGRTKILYSMFRFCPWLLPIILPVYRCIRIAFRGTNRTIKAQVEKR